jgi:chromosome partitioning protein
MHIAVALMKSDQRLATIDLDSRQRTLTHYIENRRAWARRCHVDLELPTHLTIAYAEGARVDENEAAEFADFGKAVAAIEHRHGFVVIDTPPHDSYLMRLAHSVTDTLVTPLNDSFLDLDVLAKIDPVTFAVTGVSHYAELVREMRRHRRLVDGDLTDWVVVRNRISPSGSSAKPVSATACRNWRSRWAYGSQPASMNARSIAIFSRAGSPRWMPFATSCPPSIQIRPIR